MADDSEVTRVEQPPSEESDRGLVSRPIRKGQRIGRFLMLKLIGEGGLGQVFAAYDPELDRKIAIKLVKVRPGGDPAAERDALHHEAKALARIAHPNVLTVFEVGLHRGSVFLAMEYVEGENLRQWLQSGPRTFAEIRRMFVAAGRGLQAVHAAGLVHRDFKPANVLVGADGRVRVVDFGLAQAAREPGASFGPGDSEPEPTDLAGTPAYMPIEQLLCQKADARSDQYSFCVSLWEAVYGQRPFAGRTLDELRESVGLGVVRPPANGRAPAWFARVVAIGLQPDPAARYPELGILLAELERDRWALARRLALLVLGVLTVVAGVGVVHEWTRPGQIVVAVPHPTWARVLLDDVEMSKESGRFVADVDPGVHAVRVSARDHEPAERAVAVERGAQVEIEIGLRRTQGLFDLTVAPAGSTIYVDGDDHGARLRHTAIDTGPHDLLIRHRDYYDRHLRWSADPATPQRGYVSLPEAVVWSRRYTGVIGSPSIIGDADADGRPDILHSTYSTWTVTSPNEDRDVWRVELSKSVASVVKVVELDGDGVSDLVAVVGSEEGSVTVTALSGRIEGARAGGLVREPRRLWTRTLRGTGFGSESCAVEGEGEAARIVLALSTGEVVTLGGDGEVVHRWRSPMPDPPQHVLRGAGQFFALGATWAAAIEPERGATLWFNAPFAVSGAAEFRGDARAREHDSIPFPDLDGDGHVDLLVRATRAKDGELVALSGADGRLLWSLKAPEGGQLGVRGVLPGDGGVDLVVDGSSEAYGWLGRVNGVDGAPRWQVAKSQVDGSVTVLTWPEAPVPVSVYESRSDGLVLRGVESGRVWFEASTAVPSAPPIVSDWDADGRRELIVGTDDGSLLAYRPDGELVGSALVPRPVRHVAAVGDVDRDGFGDYLATSRGPMLIHGPNTLWQREADDALRARPLVLDLDGDGALALVVAGDFGEGSQVHVFEAATGDLRFASRVRHDMLRSPTPIPRQGGGFDLAVQDPGRLVRMSGRDGRILAEVSGRQFSYTEPARVDLDGDGEFELVVTPWNKDVPLRGFHEGELRERWSFPLATGGWAPVQAVQIDGTGALELIVAEHTGLISALSLDGPRVLWQVDVDGRLIVPPLIADLDLDGRLEVIVGGAENNHAVVALDLRDGRELWRRSGLGGGNTQPILLVEGERRLLICPAPDFGLVALDPRLRQVWMYSPDNVDGEVPDISAPLVLADLEHDGASEVLAGFRDGSLHVLDANTGAFRWQVRGEKAQIEAAPVAADVDRDGLDEVIVVGYDRMLRVLRSPGRAGGGS